MSATPSSQPPIRAVRLAHGLTLRRLAERSGIHEANLSRIERGLTQPSVPQLKAIADALGLHDLARSLAPYVVKRERRAA